MSNKKIISKLSNEFKDTIGFSSNKTTSRLIKTKEANIAALTNENTCLHAPFSALASLLQATGSLESMVDNIQKTKGVQAGVTESPLFKIETSNLTIEQASVINTMKISEILLLSKGGMELRGSHRDQLRPENILHSTRIKQFMDIALELDVQHDLNKAIAASLSSFVKEELKENIKTSVLERVKKSDPELSAELTMKFRSQSKSGPSNSLEHSYGM